MILGHHLLIEKLGTGELVVEPLMGESVREMGVDLYLKPTALDIDTKVTTKKIVNNRAYLFETVEKFNLPSNLCAEVSIRSSWARQGFLVPSTWVDPGFRGNLTIEVFNGGPTRIMQKEERIIHLIFHEVQGATSYEGKYTNQSGITQAKES